MSTAVDEMSAEEMAVAETMAQKPSPAKNVDDARFEVMKRVLSAHKGGTNEFQNYRYVAAAELLAQLRPHMLENGLILTGSLKDDAFFVPTQGETNTHIVYHWELKHLPSGTAISVNIPGSGNDRNRSGVGDKGTYKAITGSMKYALLDLFMLPTFDDPEEARADEAPAYVPQKEPCPPASILSTPGGDEKLMAWVNRTLAEATELNDLNTAWKEGSGTFSTLKAINESKHAKIVELFNQRKQQLS